MPTATSSRISEDEVRERVRTEVAAFLLEQEKRRREELEHKGWTTDVVRQDMEAAAGELSQFPAYPFLF